MTNNVRWCAGGSRFPLLSGLLAVYVAVGWFGVAAASAQVIETVGSRALGMGGAFVAVANDSSATWWNPAALADGPFVDLSFGRAVTEQRDHLPAWRDRASWFAMTTPPFGLSYYKVTATQVRAVSPAAGLGAGRQEDDVRARSLTATQWGATVLRTILPGVHMGTTVKYLRGTLRSGAAHALSRPADGLADGEALEGGQAENRFDLDLGALATAGAVRVGAVVRNLRQPSFGPEGFTLPRQVRAGAAVDGGAVGRLPLTVTVDADLRAYQTATGDRRVIAVGAEQWLHGRRLALRGGARFNRVGAAERSVTGGVSVAVRTGTYLEGYVVGGGTPEERGWGTSARVSF